MKPTTVALTVAGTLAASLLAYAVHFDYKRRNDPAFRRQIRKNKKKTMKQKKKQEEMEAKDMASMIASALKLADEGPKAPEKVEEKEAYFMEQVSKGESLLPLGSSGYTEAAAAFFRALRVYPSPMEMVMIYQKTLPEPVFRLVMGMMSYEMQEKQERYYQLFPPKEMGVRLEKRETGRTTSDGTKIIRQTLVASKAYKAGETLYTEKPVVSALEPSLEGKHYCHHCLTHTVTTLPCPTCSEIVYCSKSCQETADSTYHASMCSGSTSPVSGKLGVKEMVKEGNLKVPSMIAKLFTTAVAEEQKRIAAELPSEEYGVWEHLERLRYLELTPGPEEAKERDNIISLLSTKVPGMEEFVNEERYLTLKGRILYNFYAIHAPISPEEGTPESKEQPREGTSTQVKGTRTQRIGAGLYKFTSYAIHSCDPNAKVIFPIDSGNTLTLQAEKDIAEGDEVRVSFVPVQEKKSDRAVTLAKYWRIECACPRCQKEEEEKEEEETKDEKIREVEAEVKRVEDTISAVEEVVKAAQEEATEIKATEAAAEKVEAKEAAVEEAIEKEIEKTVEEKESEKTTEQEEEEEEEEEEETMEETVHEEELAVEHESKEQSSKSSETVTMTTEVEVEEEELEEELEEGDSYVKA
ncbi:MAG: MAS20 protein import receptor-domain-containing protein [Piptocephalis tieghemiana]|nr:MAG: MAS20 protein import receptor-domain-containing protein [Piptocephalis tieghemiana]